MLGEILGLILGLMLGLILGLTEFGGDTLGDILELGLADGLILGLTETDGLTDWLIDGDPLVELVGDALGDIDWLADIITVSVLLYPGTFSKRPILDTQTFFIAEHSELSIKKSDTPALIRPSKFKYRIETKESLFIFFHYIF